MNKGLKDSTRHIKNQGKSLDFGGRAIVNAKLVNCTAEGGDIGPGGGAKDAVKYTEQSLTDSQKEQARTNIDAASAADVAANAAAIAAEAARAAAAEQDVMDAIDGTNVETVTVLPEASASTVGKIYYVGPDSDGEYARYRGIESDGSYSFLSLGTTKMDLTDYATKKEVSQVSQELYKSFTPIEAGRNIPNYYIVVPAGTTGSASAKGYVNKYDVSAMVGRKIRVKSTATNYNGAGFYTADISTSTGNTIIDVAFALSEDWTYLTVPVGAKTFAASANNAGVITLQSITDDFVVLQQKEAEDRAAIAASKTRLNALDSYVGKDTVVIGNDVLNHESGAIRSDSGATETASSFIRSDYVEVGGFTKARVILPERYPSGTSQYYGLAFYDADKTYISGEKLVSSYNATIASYTEVSIPATAKYLRTCVQSEFEDTWALTLLTKGSLVPVVDDLLDRVGGQEELIYANVLLEADGEALNQYIDSSGNLAAQGGTTVKKYNVSAYAGKKVRIVNTTGVVQVKWAFYESYTTGIASGNLYQLGDTGIPVDSVVTIPNGVELLALSVGIFGNPPQDVTATVTLIQTKFDLLPETNGAGYPTAIPGWERPAPYQATTIENGRTLLRGGKLSFGGANILYGKKLATMGDSLLNNPFAAWLSMISGCDYVSSEGSFNKGGSATRPGPKQYINGGWNSGQDRARALVASGYQPDFIIYENANDRPVNSETIGLISDTPWMLSQYIDYGDYASAADAEQGWDDDFSTILVGETPKRGSVVRLQYTTSAVKITLTGTASVNGQLIVTIDGVQYATDVRQGDTAETIASNAAEWDYAGYSSSASSGVLTLTKTNLSAGTPAVATPSGITSSASSSSAVSWVFRYYVGMLEEDFTDKTKWISTVPSLYACYKGLMEYLITNFPEARIVFLGVTAPYVDYSDSAAQDFQYADGTWNIYAYRTTQNTTAWQDEKLREIQGNIAELYGIKFIDLDKKCGINLINFSHYYNSYDVHPKSKDAVERWAEITYHELIY